MAVARVGCVCIMETVLSIKVHLFCCWKDLGWVGKLFALSKASACPGPSEKAVVPLITSSKEEKLGDKNGAW